MPTVKINPHFTPEPAHEKIGSTFVGQCHVAGTGPKGKTCRECKYFGRKEPGIYAYYGHQKHCNTPGALKDAYCHNLGDFPGKAFRQFPHTAPACVFFEQSDHAPVAVEISQEAKKGEALTGKNQEARNDPIGRDREIS